MARVNHEAEMLRRHVDTLKRALDKLYENPPDMPFLACGHLCVAAVATGMATNGPCNCDERKLRRAVAYWRMVATHRLAVIDLHRRLGCSDPGEDAVERIVEWLRKEAAGLEGTFTCDVLRDVASDIERGDWQAVPSPGGEAEGNVKR